MDANEIVFIFAGFFVAAVVFAWYNNNKKMKPIDVGILENMNFHLAALNTAPDGINLINPYIDNEALQTLKSDMAKTAKAVNATPIEAAIAYMAIIGLVFTEGTVAIQEIQYHCMSYYIALYMADNKCDEMEAIIAYNETSKYGPIIKILTAHQEWAMQANAAVAANQER